MLVASSSLFAQENVEDSVFEIDRLHPAALDPPAGMDLTNPRGLMRSFTAAVEAEEFERAASALRQTGNSEISAPGLAKMLGEVIERQLWIDGGRLPDRPDALIDAIGDNPRAGQTRRSISLGMIDLDNYPVTLRINRYKTSDSAPVWLFSEWG